MKSSTKRKRAKRPVKAALPVKTGLASELSGTCTTNRRSRSAMRDLRGRLYEIVAAYKPMTCRQVFYQAVSRGLIEKTDGEYRRTICRLLLDVRRNPADVSDAERTIARRHFPEVEAETLDPLQDLVTFYTGLLYDR